MITNTTETFCSSRKNKAPIETELTVLVFINIMGNKLHFILMTQNHSHNTTFYSLGH